MLNSPPFFRQELAGRDHITLTFATVFYTQPRVSFDLRNIDASETRNAKLHTEKLQSMPQLDG